MGMVFFFVLCCIIALIPIFVMGYGENDTLYRIVVLAFCIVFAIFCVFVFLDQWAIIVVDKTGLKKSLLGKHRKSIAWEEIVDVKLFGTLGGGWIFFSKTDLTGKSLDKCRKLKKTNITMRMSPEFYDAVKYYSGDILGTKTFPSLPADLVQRWEANKDRIEWGGDRILPRRQANMEAGKDVIPPPKDTPPKKTLSQLAAEAKEEEAKNPKAPPTDNPWDKYK